MGACACNGEGNLDFLIQEFDPTRKDKYLKLDPGCGNATGFGYCSLLHPFDGSTQARVTFKIKQLKDSKLEIGLWECSTSTYMHEGEEVVKYKPVREAKWYLRHGSIIIDGQETDYTDARPKQGDTIGLEVNERGKLIFYHNGTSLGTAYEEYDPKFKIFPFINLRENGGQITLLP